MPISGGTMSIKKLNPYLTFNGKAQEAIHLYEKALGAKPDGIIRFKDVPGMEATPENADRIMHALLRIDDQVLMVSDTMPKDPAPAESNTHVCVDFNNLSDLVKAFDTLAAGGKATYPVHDTFWGAKFGMLTDAFGVRWMLNCEQKNAV
jgi:PhnB protein